jgi:hypothetical protein
MQVLPLLPLVAPLLLLAQQSAAPGLTEILKSHRIRIYTPYSHHIADF